MSNWPEANKSGRVDNIYSALSQLSVIMSARS